MAPPRIRGGVVTHLLNFGKGGGTLILCLAPRPLFISIPPTSTKIYPQTNEYSFSLKRLCVHLQQEVSVIIKKLKYILFAGQFALFLPEVGGGKSPAPPFYFRVWLGARQRIKVPPP